MDIAHAPTIPLGLPAYLVVDELQRGVPPASILAPEDSLLAEFQSAHGYAFRWGDIIEVHRGTSLAWHFVPVELWFDTDRLRRWETAAALIPALQPDVAKTLKNRLPVELVLSGCHLHARRDPHALFSLVLIEPRQERKARRWLSAVFVPGLLPEVLDRVRSRLTEICQSEPRRE